MKTREFHKAVQPGAERPIFDRLKEHPIWLFCSGAAAMAAFAITVVMPGTTAYLRAQIEDMKPAHEKLTEANRQVEQLKSDLKKARNDRDEAGLKNPFTTGSGYPIGLTSIVIGSPISKIAEAFPKEVVKTSIEEGETFGYKSLDTKHSVYGHVAYYYSTTGKLANTVSSILFLVHGSGIEHEFLRSKLTQLNGPPKVESKGRYFWELTARESIAIEDGKLEVFSRGSSPIWIISAASKKLK